MNKDEIHNSDESEGHAREGLKPPRSQNKAPTGLRIDAEVGMIRILVADDHPIVRDGLVAILSTQADFLVVGEAANGEDIVQQVPMVHPDILLLDLEMPRMDGVTALERLRATGAPIRAIAFTAFDTDERILGALRAGAQGYLLKGTPREEIFRAIRAVHAGGSLLESTVALKVLHSANRSKTDEPSLTARETEVLHALARGRINKEIARELGISERTVKFHVTALLHKLNAGNRTEAVTIAAQRGLLHLDG